MSPWDDLEGFYESSIEKIRTTYGDEQLYQSLDLLETLLKALSSPPDEHQGEAKSLISKLENSVLCRSIRREVAECNELLAALDEADALESSGEKQLDDHGWRVFGDRSEFITMYRSEKGSNMHSICVKGFINAPVSHIVALINEIDLYNEWLPRVEKSLRVAQLSRARQVAYSRMKGLMFVASREVLVYGYGVDALETHDRVIIYAESVDSCDDLAFDPPELSSTLQPVPERKGKTVRVDVKIGGCVLEPISSTQTLCRMVFNFDPKLSFIPTALLNYVMHHIVRFSFRKMKDLVEYAEDEGNLSPLQLKFASRIRSNRTLYGPLEERVAEYLEGKHSRRNVS